MKQYVVSDAYADNYHVFLYEDGLLKDHEILAYYELDGYLEAIKKFGYEKSCYVPDYERKMQEAKEAYEYALSALEEAKKHPLQLSSEEAERLEKIAGFGL